MRFESTRVGLWGILLTVVPGAFAQYPWPLAPVNQQHRVTGTFCENRPSGSVLRHHFHDGTDIGSPQGTAVYAVADARVTTIGSVAQYGSNSYVRTERFAYVHINPNPALSVGDSVHAGVTVVGTINSQNHVHFKDGYPGSEINALRPTGLSPFVDGYNPQVVTVEFFENGTTRRLSSTALTGRVDIVAQARDISGPTYSESNNGIYRIGYEIRTGDGSQVISGPGTSFQFDRKPSDSYITNVYAEGSDLSTYRYTITNQITRDGYWDTGQVPAGEYLVRVFAHDTQGRGDTVTVRVRVAPLTAVSLERTSKAPPRQSALWQNYPNPFNPTTVISYQLSVISGQKSRWVTLKIYDLLGKEVRTLVDEPQGPGHYAVRWDGRDNRGQVLPSGVYIYRLKAGDFQQVRRLTVVR